MGLSVWPSPAASVLSFWPTGLSGVFSCEAVVPLAPPLQTHLEDLLSRPQAIHTSWWSVWLPSWGAWGALQAFVGFCHPARSGALGLEALVVLPDGRPLTAGCCRFPTTSDELGTAVGDGQGGYTPSTTVFF